jgi:hypothetical protein
MTARKVPPGLPTGKFAELLEKTNQPGPYVVTDEIQVVQPTKKRRDEITKAQFDAAMARNEAGRLLNSGGTDTDIRKLSAEAQEFDKAGDKAFFGPDVYDDLVAFFADYPDTVWEEFREAVREHFYPSKSQPEDGSCPTCGHIEDVEAAGKAPKSTTG